MSRLPDVERGETMQMAVALEILEMARPLLVDRIQNKTPEEIVKTLTDLYIETWKALGEASRIPGRGAQP